MNDRSYLHDGLLPENLYGHTKKVRLMRDSLDRIRRHKTGGGLRILDIGCGNGHAVTRFLAHTGDQVSGIDLHVPSIDFATRQFATEGLRFDVKSVEVLTSLRETFDVVVLADVLEHVANPSETLVAARRLLADGGRILVSIPNGRGPFEIESFARRLFFVGWILSILARIPSRTGRLLGRRRPLETGNAGSLPYNSSSGHVHFFTRPRITDMAAAAGLSVTHWRNLAFLCGPFSGELLPDTPSVCNWNTAMADKLPYWAVSAWYFELMPNHGR